jgi:hypothetical protein
MLSEGGEEKRELERTRGKTVDLHNPPLLRLLATSPLPCGQYLPCKAWASSTGEESVDGRGMRCKKGRADKTPSFAPGFVSFRSVAWQSLSALAWVLTRHNITSLEHKISAVNGPVLVNIQLCAVGITAKVPLVLPCPPRRCPETSTG